MCTFDLFLGVKKIGVQFAIFLMSMSVYSQIGQMNSNTADRHEFNVNAFNLFALKAPNVSYEYLFNENISLGLGLLYKFDRADPRERGFGTAIVEYRIYSVTPYMRRYLSKGYASGFFIEGFGMLNSGDAYRSVRVVDETSNIPGETKFVDELVTQTSFALGISFGGKFLLGKKGVLLEIYFGMGIPGVIGQSSPGGAVSRGGVSLGYRF